MSISLIAERYAKALFDLAVEQEELDRVNSDMTELVQVCQKNRDLVLMLRSPVISLEKKEKILKTIFGERFARISMHFLLILVRKRREFFIPDIVNDFVMRFKEFKNILTVHLITAVPVNQSTIQRVKEFMKGYSNKDIELVVTLDPEIIGGYILNWSDMRYDASISHQIERLRRGSARINLYVKGF